MRHLLEAGPQAIFEKLRARLWSNFLQLLGTRKDISMKGGLNVPDGILGDWASWTTRRSLMYRFMSRLHSPKDGGRGQKALLNSEETAAFLGSS